MALIDNSVSKSSQVIVVGMITMIILVLSSNAPGGASFQMAQSPPAVKGIAIPRYQRHQLWVLFGLRFAGRYMEYQFRTWAIWVVSSCTESPVMWANMYVSSLHWVDSLCSCFRCCITLSIG